MDTRAAFDLLWDADQHGTAIDSLPGDLCPRTREEAYAVQEHWADVAGGVVGWKIAATAEAGQRHIGVDGPLPGRMLADRVQGPGAVSLAGNRMRLIELEFAFVLARGFAPRAEAYAVEEVADGVGELQLSFELPSSRFADVPRAGAEQLLADNACGHRLVLGPAASQDWRGTDLAGVAVSVTNSNGTVHRGSGAAVLGHPLVALTWLVNELSTNEIALEPGQFVTTGVCTDPLPVAPGETVVGDWGPFGTMEITLVE